MYVIYGSRVGYDRASRGMVRPTLIWKVELPPFIIVRRGAEQDQGVVTSYHRLAVGLSATQFDLCHLIMVWNKPHALRVTIDHRVSSQACVYCALKVGLHVLEDDLVKEAMVPGRELDEIA